MPEKAKTRLLHVAIFEPTGKHMVAAAKEWKTVSMK
jgi:hypothetical protein